MPVLAWFAKIIDFALPRELCNYLFFMFLVGTALLVRGNVDDVGPKVVLPTIDELIALPQLDFISQKPRPIPIILIEEAVDEKAPPLHTRLCDRIESVISIANEET